MESFKPISLPGAESKIQEYVGRIKKGESKESIFQGLPESFRTNIDARLAQTEVVPTTQVTPEEKTLTKEIEPENVLSTDERKKLHGWTASYELAKIAKQQGIDLSQLSREEYVDFAIKENLMIDDTQLRIAPWQRMGTSVEEIVLSNRERKAQIEEEKEKAFAKFSFETQQKAAQDNRYLSENIRVRQGTKDSNSWLFFGINNGIDSENPETHKAYASVKDLNTLTPERFNHFMEALRDAGYNGDIKIFQDLSEQGVRLNDQIVMHGGSQEDAELALQTAQEFFADDIDQVSLGKDEIIDGKSKSYSQILADKIKESIQK